MGCSTGENATIGKGARRASVEKREEFRGVIEAVIEEADTGEVVELKALPAPEEKKGH